MAKTTDRLHGYARLGAAIRRAELVAELHAIDKAFPDLRFQKRTAALLKTSGSTATAASEILGGTKEERGVIKRPERPALCETPRLVAQATAVISASCSL